jgi:hypothetical protein
VTRLVLFDGWTPKFGFLGVTTTSRYRTYGYWDSYFYWDLDNLGVVEHIAYSRDKYNNRQ